MNASGTTMFFVDMLASKPNGTLYIGVTRDLIRRVHEHKTKAVPGFTAKYDVTRFVYVETFDDPETAIGAFSAKVGTGFVDENATNQNQAARSGSRAGTGRGRSG